MKRILILMIVAVGSAAMAAEPLRLTLDDAITRARTHSVGARSALARLRSAYWAWRTYRADLLPEVTFTGTVPSYNRRYSTYQNADGSYSFVSNNNLRFTGEISVTQNIWFTGGTLALNTSLDFMRQLGPGAYSRIMSIPVSLTWHQPLFGVNRIRWDRRIEPLRYREAQARFLSESEDVAMQAIDAFFSLMLARENLHISEQNYANAVRLHEVAIEKRDMGRISLNDLRQMELNVINAESSLTDCRSALNGALFALRSLLDYGEETEIDPIAPEQVPHVAINYNDALAKALQNNQFSLNIMRRQLEADYGVATARGNLRQVTLFAQVGLTGTGPDMHRAYDPLKDNQVVEVGLSVPLLDWGKRRGKVRVAESNRRLIESQLREETRNFHQDIFLLVERFNNQQRQLALAARADTLAMERYETNVQTFMIGQISTLDLNDSQSAKDSARRALLNQLYLYWQYFYRLRSLTLWDYAADMPLQLSDGVKNGM